MESELRNIFNLASDAFIIFNDNGEIVDVNRQACQMYGYYYEEFVELTCWDTVHPDYCYIFDKFIRDIQNTGEFTGESVDIRKNGEVFNIEVSGTEFMHQDQRHYLAIIRDITPRKEEEKFLIELFDYQMNILDEFPYLIWKTGSDGRGNYFNRSWLKFTGRTVEEELGEGWMTGIHPDDLERFEQDYWDAFESQRYFELEHRLRRYDGKYRWVVNSASPFEDKDGNFAGYIGACHDITNRKRNEQALQKQYERFKHEMELAASVQYEMLPKDILEISNINFAWKYEPSVYIAGDMFNFFRLDEENISFYILDVMGHGIQAALKAVTLNCFLKPSLEQMHYPSEILKTLNLSYNDELNGVSEGEFFTIFYGVINSSSLELTYSRAGHNPPILISTDGGIKELTEGGPAAGLSKDMDYKEYKVNLKSKDKLFLYTDGVVEARNNKKEFYSKKRLKKFIQENKDNFLKKITDGILNDVKAHTKNKKVMDDLTILGIEID